MNFANKRWFGYLLIGITYFVGTLVGILTYSLLPFSFWLNLLIADVVSTIFVYIISLITKNASVYDPYWSVQPIVIVLAFCIDKGFSTTSIILLAIITIWGIRLTANWAYTFKGIKHMDWRYTNIKNNTGKLYPIVNFLGIHLVPTLIVYACTLPAVFAIQYNLKFNPLMLIFVAISVFAVTIQTISDIQMHKYRKNKTTPFIRVGLWKYSRHPNYLGEILMWWGVGLSVFILNYSFYYLLIGALLNTLLFLFISIPMADKRQSKKEGFNEYKSQTRMLLPIYKKQKNAVI
jgi:steroid 5-alpha reductase family enzyme